MVITARRNAEHAVNTANRAPHGSADDSTHGARIAIAAPRAFVDAPENALGMGYVRNGEYSRQRQRGRQCKPGKTGSAPGNGEGN